jgi:hypothetical protein
LGILMSCLHAALHFLLFYISLHPPPHAPSPARRRINRPLSSRNQLLNKNRRGIFQSVDHLVRCLVAQVKKGGEKWWARVSQSSVFEYANSVRKKTDGGCLASIGQSSVALDSRNSSCCCFT